MKAVHSFHRAQNKLSNNEKKVSFWKSNSRHDGHKIHSEARTGQKVEKEKRKNVRGFRNVWLR